MNCHFHVAEVSPSYISFHLIEAHTVAQAEIPGYDMMICECEYKRQHKTQDMSEIMPAKIIKNGKVLKDAWA